MNFRIVVDLFWLKQARKKKVLNFVEMPSEWRQEFSSNEGISNFWDGIWPKISPNLTQPSPNPTELDPSKQSFIFKSSRLSLSSLGSTLDFKTPVVQTSFTRTKLAAPSWVDSDLMETFEMIKNAVSSLSGEFSSPDSLAADKWGSGCSEVR